MSLAVGIKFDPDSFPKFFRPADLLLEENDFCVVRDGKPPLPRVGYVTCFEGRCPHQIERLGTVERFATEEEIDEWHRLCRRRSEALTIARGKVVDHGLPMKIISVKFDDEQKVVLFFFTADHRIDFRELVRDLAGVFKARIELWQIGSRQGAAEKDGFGLCGQPVCCSTWMKSFPPISIRQARDQDINQPPPKLSGLCGRLRCCLRYEHEGYCKMKKGAPALGSAVRDASDREGVVVDRNLLTGVVVVQFEKTKAESLRFDQVMVLRPAAGGAPREEALPPPAEEDDEPIISEDDEGAIQ